MFDVCLGARSNVKQLSIIFVTLTLLTTVQCSPKIDGSLAPKLSTKKATTTGNLIQNSTQTTRDRKLELNCTESRSDKTAFYNSLPYRIFAGALVVPITICAISGNILVIYVIKRYPNLRVTGNVFLASLAVADVGVSTLAMTFYGAQLIQGKWVFGAFMCRLWFSCDVLFSTASIIHLACIALDRYLSIVHPFQNDTPATERRRSIMIFSCWFVSALLSFIPIFTGLYTNKEQRQKIDCLDYVKSECIFAVNQAYAIVSSSFSFWVPGAIMIIIYVMLIRIADKKESEAYRRAGGVERRRASQLNPCNVSRRASEAPMLPEAAWNANREHQLSLPGGTNGHQNQVRPPKKRDSLDVEKNRHSNIDIAGSTDSGQHHMKHLRRERRAVKTLGAIMIAFIICWLPFFIRYTACEPNRCEWYGMRFIEDIVFWVGYCNSMMNPFLYAFHNKDFRDAFSRTLKRYFGCFGMCDNQNDKIGLPPKKPNKAAKAKKKKLKAEMSKKRVSDETELHPLNKPKLSTVTVTINGSNGNLDTRENSISSKSPPAV